MTTIARILPSSERTEPDHSFISAPDGRTPIFAGWGPKL